MRPALVTLLPMFAAAGFVLVGGERMAHREIEERTSADRERLLDFADAFETEMDRLDSLYESHLIRAAETFERGATAEAEELAREIPTVRAMHLRTVGHKGVELSLLPVGSRERLPEIVLEEQDRPLNPNNAITIPKDLLDWTQDGTGGWLSTPNLPYQVYWTRPDESRLVIFVINRQDLHQTVGEHLTEWMSSPLTPLREAGERVAIRAPNGRALVSTGEGGRGPAVLVMPFRTTLGDWQIQAWDRVTVRTERETATLTAAGAIAAVLAIGGIFLWLQQRRALRLAEERVSFVNRVSHELGSPLTNVALNLDLATEALDTRPPEARRRLGIVTEEIERLARLVANVLTFSRQERQTLELDPQPCAPNEIISKTLDSFRPALRRRGIEIEFKAGAPSRVRLDPDALEQIVGNLISNVEKYAAEGGWIGIESTLTNGDLRVLISDRGTGIPTSARERIFRPFERVRREVNEGSSGTGLGLSIARELATRMGGTLTLLDSSEGTRFELLLPAPDAMAVVPDNESSAA